MATTANAKKTENIRIRSVSYETVRALAEQTQQSALDILDKAVNEYRRKVIFEDADRRYAALQEDPDVWNEVLREQEEWDSTLLDGLEPEERRESP